MGSLICDFPNHPGHPPVKVAVDPPSFAEVQDAVQKHFAGGPGNSIYGALAQNSPKWHIIPVGPDWHITPYP